MPGNAAGTERAVTYPPSEQYDRWKTAADEMDMSVSGFIASMTEAGMKKFDPRDVEPDESRLELREQRNELKRELDAARDRIRDLEDRVHDSERDEIHAFVADNPGASFDRIIQHVVSTAPERADWHLTELESAGDLRVDGDEYYPATAAATDGGIDETVRSP